MEYTGADGAVHSTHDGFYKFSKVLLTLMLTGSNPRNPQGDFPDPCGLNITCLIHRVFDDHLPMLGRE